MDQYVTVLMKQSINAPHSFVIEIHPKKAEWDPLAKQIRSELIERGEKPANAVVQTQRLFRIEGNFSQADLDNIAHTVLVDPVVENVIIEKAEGKPSKKTGGFVLDVWPKPGVTDPVGETIEKGLFDLGFKGFHQAASAVRYVFPKIKQIAIIENLAKQVLANELVHDIIIRKN
ncbi:MAG: Phosphoribosylformylglycinamidine synthase subunit PurS [Elusimicrobia bacterium]|nr:Phosphoribosylformylglycinamidine synthase subunit PurS [Elusimicrobiota bacterium]